MRLVITDLDGMKIVVDAFKYKVCNTFIEIIENDKLEGPIVCLNKTQARQIYDFLKSSFEGENV